ncbi:MAG: NACHT domain-containing protein, partial [Desulfosarcina sp.]
MVDARTIAKSTVPDLTRAISRPRLLQRVSAVDSARVILITGQAAQGKSTLAAEIVRQTGPAVAWMHLDPPDSDPVNFFLLLVHAVRASRPGLNVSAYLQRPSIALGKQAGRDRVAELTEVFIADVVAQAPIRIVIDGIDRIGDHDECLVLVHTILERIKPPSCLILISRTIPKLKLESLRVR